MQKGKKRMSGGREPRPGPRALVVQRNQMLPGKQENSTEVDELQGVTLEEAERVLTLEHFLLRIKRPGLLQRVGWG